MAPDTMAGHAVTEHTAGQHPTGEDPWSAGLTGPQRAFPVWDGAPGYEFEGRRSANRSMPVSSAWPRDEQGTPLSDRAAPLSDRAARWDDLAAGWGDQAGRWDEQAARWGEQAAYWDEQPGFEFDVGARTADPSGPPGRRPGPPPRPGGARAEWAGLLRSFLPEPVKRNWFAEFRSALHFRGAGTRVIIPIVTMMVFGAAVAVIAGANSSDAGPAPPPAALGFPPPWPATRSPRRPTAAASARRSAG